MHIARKSVLLLLVDNLAELLFSSRLLPQDLSDSLAGHVSSGVAAALFVLVMARMYLFRSIECFVPPEWPVPWEQAAEAYCFMEGAFAVPRVNLNKTGPDAWEVKVPQTYYYWLPMILMALAAILKMPDILWSYYCGQTDLQPGPTLMAVASLTSGAEAAEEGTDEAARLFRRLGEHLLREGECGKGDFKTCQLFRAYLVSKTLRIAATLGSVVFLQRSFGLSNPLFGVAAWIQRSSPFDPAAFESFPTLTFCDVALRQLGGWNTRTVQCVLPINLLLDKIAIFLWFWLVACAALCAGSTVVWLVRLGSVTRRRRYVKTFVRVMQDCEERRLERRLKRRRRLELQRRERGIPLPEEELPAGGLHQEDQQQPPSRKLAPSPAGQSPLIDAIGSVDRVFFLRLVQDRLGMAAAYVAMETMTVHCSEQLPKTEVETNTPTPT